MSDVTTTEPSIETLRRKMIAAKGALTRINHDRRYHYRMYGLDTKYQYLTERYNERMVKFQEAERAWLSAKEE